MSLETILNRTKRWARRAALATTLAASALVPAGARAAGIQPQGVFAAAADNPGKYGTRWETTVWASQDVADDATLTLCAATNDAPADECHEYNLPRGTVVTIPNAWDGFTAAPPGGLVWRVDGVLPEQVALFSRTYTIAPTGAVGTLGQGVPAQRLPDEVPLVGRSQYVPLAARDGFRSNVGFFNSTGAPSTIKVRIKGTGGGIVAEQEFSLPGYGWHQITDIFNAFGVEPFKGGYAEVIQMTGERLAVYGSVVDNTSGDPTFLPAKTRYNGQQQLWIPAVAHLPGYNGTTWLTDVSYLNASNVNQSQAGLDFYPYNHDNSNGGAIGQSWLMGSGEMKTILDTIHWLGALGLPGNENGTKGSLWQAPLDSHLIWSRTYNDRGAEGTFGQSLPAIRSDQPQIAGSLEGVLIGLSESTDSATGYRSSVGLLNTGTTPATFHLELYDSNGTLEGTLDQDVPPMSLVQLDKVYRKVTSADITNGRVVVKATTGQGFAYASIIDNQNGDASTEYATIINPTTNNHAPEFVGMDYHNDGTVDWGDADGDGEADVSISFYPSDPTRVGRAVFSDPDGDPITCTYTPGPGTDALPEGFTTDGCVWTFSPPRVPGMYEVTITASDGRGGETSINQLYNVRDPPQ